MHSGINSGICRRETTLGATGIKWNVEKGRGVEGFGEITENMKNMGMFDSTLDSSRSNVSADKENEINN